MIIQQIAQLSFYALMLAFIPSLVVMVLFFFADKFEKEPLNVLFRCLIFGAALAIPIAIIQTFVPCIYTLKFESEITRVLYRVSILAPLFEESLKFIIVLLIVVRSKHFNEPFDGIVYYVAVGVGFAIIEDWGYIVSFSSDSFFKGMATGDMSPFFTASFKISGIRAWPGHALYGALSGYFLSVGSFIKRKQIKKYYILALIVGIASHSIFNTICGISHFYKVNSLIYLLPYMIVLLIIVIITGKTLLKASPFNKPEKEIASQDLHALIASRKYSAKNLQKFLGYIISTIIVILLIEAATCLLYIAKYYDIFFDK